LTCNWQNFQRRWGASLFGLMVCLPLLTISCASPTAYVIARQSARYPLSLTNRITIADHAQPREEEQSLRTTLLAELHQLGFKVVSPDQAEYTLTYWIDESWKRAKIVVSDREGTWAIPHDADIHSAALPAFFGPTGTSYERSLGMQHVVEVPYETKGIRLKLFHQESMRAGQMLTAWDGYIEGGDQISAKREPVLVRTLLNYFGKDFIGRAKLATLPPEGNE
jgi:hypothetical protein